MLFQVLVLIIGGLVTTYLALTLLSEQFGFGKDILKGLSILRKEAPEHFHMIFDNIQSALYGIAGHVCINWWNAN